MALSPYAQHDRLIVVDVEPPPVVVQGAEGAPPSRARCTWAGDSPPLARVAPGAPEARWWTASARRQLPDSAVRRRRHTWCVQRLAVA